MRKIYLCVIKKIPTEEVEIIITLVGPSPGAPVKYSGSKGVSYGHVTDVIATEENSGLHRWLKAAAGESVCINPALPEK